MFRPRWMGLTIFLAACGTETGNGLDTIKLGLEGSNGASGTDQANVELTVESAQAHVRHLELLLPGGAPCSSGIKVPAGVTAHCDGAKVRLDGPFTVDLLTRTSTPSLASLELPALNYKRIDVRIEPGADLGGHSLVAGGSFAGKKFAFSVDLNQDARFEDPAGVSLTAGTDDEVLLLLDVRKWFSTLPVSECAASGDLPEANGVVDLDAGTGRCKNLEKTLREAIFASGRLARGK